MKTKRTGVVTLITFLALIIAVTLSSTPVWAKVKLSQKTLYMSKGDKETLKVTGSKKKVTWKSSNKKIVTVTKKGKVTAKKIGKATITAKVGGKKLKCKVVVERKEINRARKLRAYILSRGKYSKEEEIYSLYRKYTDKDGGSITAIISASTEDKKLNFYYYHNLDAPDASFSIDFTIDLISGKSKVRSAKIEIDYFYDDLREEYLYEGNIYTKYNGKDEGYYVNRRTQTEAHYNDQTGEEEPIITIIDTEPELKELTNGTRSWINEAFVYWNKNMSSVKELKKYKISMKTIGFTKWSK